MDEKITGLPPNHIEAEMSVLGCMMLESSVAPVMRSILGPNDFYRASHGDLYSAMLAVYDDGRPIDFITVQDELERVGKLAQCGGLSYLMNLLDVVPTAAHADHYARIVRERSLLRSAIDMAREVIKQAYSPSIGSDASEIVAMARDGFEKILADQPTNDLRSAYEVGLANYASAYKYAESGRHSGYTTGFPDLDKMLVGIDQSAYVIIAARTSVGKSSMALQIAHHLSTHYGLSGIYKTQEMSAEECRRRLSAQINHIPIWKLKNGVMTAEEWRVYYEEINSVNQLPIWFIDNGDPDINRFANECQLYKDKHGAGYIVIDHIGLMSASGKASLYEDVTKVSKIARRISLKLKIPVIALCQLNRSATKDDEPQLQHLRESGAIEQDARVVIMLHRPDSTKGLPGDQPQSAFAFVRKNGEAETGAVPMNWIGQYAKFVPDSYRFGEKVLTDGSTGY